MTELTSCTQQVQSKTDILMERNSDRRTAAQISQTQQMMAKVDMHLQQVCTVMHTILPQHADVVIRHRNHAFYVEGEH